MNMLKNSFCPGCSLQMPVDSKAVYTGYYNTIPECWQVYTEVLGSEFGNAILFGQVHQLSVDTYAVQHAGASHPEKSVGIHLAGLHLMLERGLRPTDVSKFHQRLAESIHKWPHFQSPDSQGALTVCDVALAGSPQEHITLVRQWAGTVWKSWSKYHAAVAGFVDGYLTNLPPLQNHIG